MYGLSKTSDRVFKFGHHKEIMNSQCVSKDTLVGLEGGEFLMHPQADQILEWFKNNHPNYDLLSNCLQPKKTIEAVKKYQPKRLYVSLDGRTKTYNYMRGKDGYNKVIEVIETCKEIVPVSTMFTLSPYNSFKDLDEIVADCKRLDVDIRVGVYNDIEFFDTVDKAHEVGVGEVKEQQNEAEAQRSVRDKINAIREESQKKKEVLNQLQDNDLSVPKHNVVEREETANFQKEIPESVKTTSENYDFILLYDEWRKQNLKLKCYSLLDSLVIHPNGDVPICQNLGLKLGNIHKNSLDEIFNAKATQKIHKEYVHNCNQCWINFHRKYDIVLLRTLEKFVPKRLIQPFYGKYQWCEDTRKTYSQYLKEHTG